MSAQTSISPVFFGITSGVVLHTLVFRVGEWDMKAPIILLTYIILSTVAIGVERSGVLADGVPPNQAVKTIAYHGLGVLMSMLAYRGFLHRLSSFPGPFLARFSSLYVTALSARLHLFEETGKLHEQYGDYVRLGPRELSIVDPRAVRAIYSAQATVAKGPWYELGSPFVSLHNVRDKPEHARRRKVWDQGFNTKALRNYEPRVLKYGSQLLTIIENHVGEPIDVGRWFYYYSFDVMGDLSFGQSFNMLTDGKEGYFFKSLHEDLRGIGVLSHLIWILPLVKSTPGLNANYRKFWKWIDLQVARRMENEPDHLDIFSWLLTDFRQGPQTKQEKLNLHGDANLIVVAGSDTTAATLTNLFFHLALDPSFTRRLQAEIDAVDDRSFENVGNMKLLNAAIDETLRLHPAVPSGVQRVTPPQGLSIGRTFIPGDILVQMPFYTVFRDERAFIRPNEFIPERWTSRPDLVKNASVFIPFSGGPYSCVGKHLALMELRRVTLELLSRYNVSLAPDQTEADFLEGQLDTFALQTAPLKLVFTKR